MEFGYQFAVASFTYKYLIGSRPSYISYFEITRYKKTSILVS